MPYSNRLIPKTNHNIQIPTHTFDILPFYISFEIGLVNQQIILSKVGACIPQYYYSRMVIDCPPNELFFGERWLSYKQIYFRPTKSKRYVMK